MPPNGNMNQCNTTNCKRCRNKYNCSQYVNYLEDIVNSPISTDSTLTLTSEQSSVQVDLTPIISLISGLSEKIIALDGNFNNLFIDFNNTRAQISAENKEIDTKLDTFINIFKRYESQYSTEEIPTESENGLVVYDAGVSPLKPGDTYFEEKKTLFGGTKMVEKTVK